MNEPTCTTCGKPIGPSDAFRQSGGTWAIPHSPSAVERRPGEWVRVGKGRLDHLSCLEAVAERKRRDRE